MRHRHAKRGGAETAAEEKACSSSRHVMLSFAIHHNDDRLADQDVFDLANGIADRHGLSFVGSPMDYEGPGRNAVAALREAHRILADWKQRNLVKWYVIDCKPWNS